MLLPTSSFQTQTLPSPTFHISTILSLQHLLRIADATSIKWFTSACIYIPSQHPNDQYSLSTRSKIAYQAWKHIHTLQNPESDDDEPRDLWEEKFRYSNTSPLATETTSTTYPDHALLQADITTIPSFWTAEVDSLPRGSEVEWHAHLGICDGLITLVYVDTSLVDMSTLLGEGWGGKGVIPCKSLWDGEGRRLSSVIVYWGDVSIHGNFWIRKRTISRRTPSSKGIELPGSQSYEDVSVRCRVCEPSMKVFAKIDALTIDKHHQIRKFLWKSRDIDAINHINIPSILRTSGGLPRESTKYIPQCKPTLFIKGI
ncbi:hypothetical protein SS1G_04411 [Sclerotinia sclerotiorum 1980 UF-70]|uniref:Uncharacterized protein n=1 Tax=Sclerotinia sclerotiorum (strain ATCC 18683 / 1980 / Ss-1) TaxID=665079 RepID=A7EGH0_SCLS1|nr:hypothetical protein SS1G_04411 [Sclerotinia sclerotiorum 1980 UF-70]EDO01936.1 hypothetical protein SS1G_04411 [Sclerotinia sclerotiorum 1980 UF-70]